MMPFKYIMLFLPYSPVQKEIYFYVTITIIMLFLYPLLPTLVYSQQHQQQQFAFAYQTIIKNQIDNKARNNNLSSVNSNVPKLAILNFYDDDISQFTHAKPILDKYGFKGTFFIVCSWTISDNSLVNWGNLTQLYLRMSWHDIAQLHSEGHDIESHSSTHKVLDNLSSTALDYQIGQSKQCIRNHIGVEPTVFSPPHGRASKNVTAINTIAKYYDLSIGGFVTGPMFLHCDGWKQKQSTNQTDCSTYSANGTLNYANRYDIKERTHNALDKRYSHNDTQIFDKFTELVNSQINFNKNGTIDAIPIIGYHDIDNNKTITSTDVSLFDAEMKYLHDNGFKVLTMSDLGYDENSKYLYIKNNRE
jgi:peptidoglycan/xylan/chitin deacetylase (PgdA/CDA1 family)